MTLKTNHPTDTSPPDPSDTGEAFGRPRRVQLRRVKGWRLPPNTVVVARPTRWGNPFRTRDRYTAVVLFTAHLQSLGEPCQAEIRHHLAGKNLACWCPLDQPCHADVLLHVANCDGDCHGECHAEVCGCGDDDQVDDHAAPVTATGGWV